MLGTFLNAVVSNYLIMYVLGYMIGAIIRFFAGFVSAIFSKDKFVPLVNAHGVVVGYRIAKIPPNTFIQYAAAYTNYKPMLDDEGNVGGFWYQRVPTVPTETDDVLGDPQPNFAPLN